MEQIHLCSCFLLNGDFLFLENAPSNCTFLVLVVNFDAVDFMALHRCNWKHKFRLKDIYKLPVPKSKSKFGTEIKGAEQDQRKVAKVYKNKIAYE